MIFKTDELVGWRLDMAVAVCLGYTFGEGRKSTGGTIYPMGVPGRPTLGAFCNWNDGTRAQLPCWHRDWALAGPLLEQHAIGVVAISDAEWLACEQVTMQRARGYEYLTAAMRCFVKAERGDTVELPE